MRLAAVLSCLCLAACATTPTAATTGETVSLRLPDLQKEEVTLAQFKGQVVLLDVWATWCGPCQKSMPFYGQLAERYGDQGLRVLAVSVDKDREALAAMAQTLPKGIRVLHDPEGTLPAQIDLQTMPTALYIDRAGRVAHRHEGFRNLDEAEIEERLQALLKGGE